MKEVLLFNGKTLIIRNALKSDALAIIDYINKISNDTDFLTFGPGEFTMSAQEEERLIETISKQATGLIIVAEVDGVIVGNLNFTSGTKPRTMHSGEFCVSVARQHWNCGIGE